MRSSPQSSILGGSAAFAAVEGSDASTWDGVWWATTTMTTAGYGDISPATDAGRAIVVMIVGIGFLTILIGSVSERFISVSVDEEVAEAEDEEDIAAAKSEIVGELRAIGTRLKELEAQAKRVGL